MLADGIDEEDEDLAGAALAAPKTKAARFADSRSFAKDKGRELADFAASQVKPQIVAHAAGAAAASAFVVLVCFGCGCKSNSDDPTKPGQCRSWGAKRKLSGGGGGTQPVGIWCAFCVNNFVIRWNFMFAEVGMALNDQLAKFQTWLQQNPDMKIKFKECTQELIAVEKGSPSRSINPEIISVSKILREVVHDPMEVLVEQSRMKQEVGAEQVRQLGFKAEEFEAPGLRKLQGFRAQWEPWMQGKKGFYPLDRSCETVYDLSFEKDSGAKRLSSDQMHEKFKYFANNDGKTRVQKMALKPFEFYKDPASARSELDDGERVPEPDERDEEVGSDVDEADALAEPQDKYAKGMKKVRKKMADDGEEEDQVLEDPDEEFLRQCRIIRGKFESGAYSAMTFRQVCNLPKLWKGSIQVAFCELVAPAEDAIEGKELVENIASFLKAYTKLTESDVFRTARNAESPLPKDFAGILLQTKLFLRKLMDANVRVPSDMHSKLAQAFTLQELHAANGDATEALKAFATDISRTSFRTLAEQQGEESERNAIKARTVCEVLAYVHERQLLLYEPGPNQLPRLQRDLTLLSEALRTVTSIDGFAATQAQREVSLLLSACDPGSGDAKGIVEKLEAAREDSAEFPIVAKLTNRHWLKHILRDAKAAVENQSNRDVLARLSSELEGTLARKEADAAEFANDWINKSIVFRSKCVDAWKEFLPTLAKLREAMHPFYHQGLGRAKDLAVLAIVASMEVIAAEASRPDVTLTSSFFGELFGLLGQHGIGEDMGIGFDKTLLCDAMRAKRDAPEGEELMQWVQRVTHVAESMAAVQQQVGLAQAWVKSYAPLAESQGRFASLDAGWPALVQSATDTLSERWGLVQASYSELQAQLPELRETDLQWDVAAPGIVREELRAALVAHSAERYEELEDCLQVFYRLPTFREKIGPDAVDKIELEVGLLRYLRDIAAAQKEITRGDTKAMYVASKAGKVAALAAPQSPALRKIAKTPQGRAICSFFRECKSWLDEACADHAMALLAPARQKQSTAKIPADYAKLFPRGEKDPRKVFTLGNIKCLEAFRDMKEKPALLELLKEVNLVHQVLSEAFKLASLKSDDLPLDLKEAWIAFRASRNEFRSVISARVVVQSLLSEDKDLCPAPAPLRSALLFPRRRARRHLQP